MNTVNTPRHTHHSSEPIDNCSNNHVKHPTRTRRRTTYLSYIGKNREQTTITYASNRKASHSSSSDTSTSDRRSSSSSQQSQDDNNEASRTPAIESTGTPNNASERNTQSDISQNPTNSSTVEIGSSNESEVQEADPYDSDEEGGHPTLPPKGYFNFLRELDSEDEPLSNPES